MGRVGTPQGVSSAVSSQLEAAAEQPMQRSTLGSSTSWAAHPDEAHDEQGCHEQHREEQVHLR